MNDWKTEGLRFPTPRRWPVTACAVCAVFSIVGRQGIVIIYSGFVHFVDSRLPVAFFVVAMSQSESPLQGTDGNSQAKLCDANP